MKGRKFPSEAGRPSAFQQLYTLALDGELTGPERERLLEILEQLRRVHELGAELAVDVVKRLKAELVVVGGRA